jgi:hypothetical protein
MPTQLNALELDKALEKNGFVEPEHRRQAWALAMRESRGYFDIKGGPNPNGTFDWGLFQINEIHSKNPNVNWDLILTADENAKFAWYLTGGGEIWAPWGLPNFDGTYTGYAKFLKDNDPATSKLYYDRWKFFYDLYPQAIKDSEAAAAIGVVSMNNLRPGSRNADVLEYVTQLRKLYFRLAGYNALRRVNPNGPTNYYGTEAKNLTAATYKAIAKSINSYGWLPKDLTVPGPALIKRLGLTII